MKRYGLSIPTDNYCGYLLSKPEQKKLINLTNKEFEKPINQRKKPFQLVKLARIKTQS